MKNDVINLRIGLEIGNRTSVISIIRDDSSSQNTAITLSAYSLFRETVFSNHPGQGAILHQGEIYRVGKSCDGHGSCFYVTSIDKYSNKDGLQILLKSLLSEVLPQGKRKEYSATVAMGMPMGWMSEETIESAKENLTGSFEIEGLKQHGVVHISKENIRVFHEPVGAYAYLRYKNRIPNIQRTVCLLDIGYNTTDTFGYINGEISPQLTLSLNHGMIDLYTLLQNHFQPLENGNRRPISHWEEIVNNYSNTKRIPDQIIQRFVLSLMNQIESSWVGIKNKENLGLIGGGGAFLKKIFDKGNIPTLDIEEPQTINAQGLAIIAKSF